MTKKWNIYLKNSHWNLRYQNALFLYILDKNDFTWQLAFILILSSSLQWDVNDVFIYNILFLKFIIFIAIIKVQMNGSADIHLDANLFKSFYTQKYIPRVNKCMLLMLVIKKTQTFQILCLSYIIILSKFV